MGNVSSPTQCLFSIGHGLHPCIACSPLVTAYTHAFFLCRWYHAHKFLFFWLSLCRFYLRPDVSVDYICRVHRRSRQYITLGMVSFWESFSFREVLSSIINSCILASCSCCANMSLMNVSYHLNQNPSIPLCPAVFQFAAFMSGVQNDVRCISTFFKSLQFIFHVI